MFLKSIFLFLTPFIPIFAASIHEKVVICGVCRDVAHTLPKTIQIIETIGSLFDVYRVVIYENNSADQTPRLLKEWEKNNRQVEVISETLSYDDLATQIVNRHENGSFFRPELISRARNIVLDKVFSNQYDTYPYLIWIDMDFKYPPRYEGFIETFEGQRDWDAVFAYGVDPSNKFWDWYALRDVNIPIGSELLGNYWWYLPRHFHLNPTDPWYPVTSAFGGCGIYKKSSLLGCRYSALITEDLEYVAKSIIEDGILHGHPQILYYLHINGQINSSVYIEKPLPNLPPLHDPNQGIRSFHPTHGLVWRMSSFVYQYPSVCEHVTLHASMIRRGHNKLFINPGLVFHY